MRFHVLGVPHTVTSKEYNACAYTQKALKFCKMMHERGHDIYHYGHEESNVLCKEHISVTTNKDLQIAYGSYDWRKNFFKYDMNDHAYQTFYKNAIREVGLRKKPNDFILPFWGPGVKPVCDAHPDIITVEPGIGYAGGYWARYKVFESYAIYHAYCGLTGVGTCKQDWYDVVIPNYFDLEDFEFSKEKDDYFLFLGRVYEGKGVHIAIQTTQKLGVKLKVAGQGSLESCGYSKIPDHVEVIGYADVEKRKKLMSRAKGAFVASLYVEPFGGVQIECLLSGTPTITTDWGAFTENNIEGVTGYRCRTFADFVNAAKNIDKINPYDCRKMGEKFSLENVAVKYEKYFQDILNIHGKKGWYELNDDILSVKKTDVECDYETIIREETPQSESIAEWIKLQNPSKVFDIGCGPGIYVDSMIKNGIDAVGYDNDPRSPHNKIDLTVDDIKEQSDITLCLEVAEHIEEKFSDVIVEKISKCTKKMIIWSAAFPGQGGNGHINCQDKQYWVDKFEKHGWRRNIEKEKDIINYVTTKRSYMGWFKINVVIFEVK
jgi:glycosyltransferase involved in cell wall biosynthesis